MRIALWPVAAVLVAVGCGEEKPKPAAVHKAPTQEQQAAAVVLRWARALVAHDWEGACATLRPQDETAMESPGVTCEGALKMLFDSSITDELKGARVRAVRIAGNRAGVDLLLRARSTPTTMAAVKQDGTW